MRHGADTLRVEVQSGHGVVTLGTFGLFLDGENLALAVEFHHAEALRVVDTIAKDRRAVARLRVLYRCAQQFAHAVAIEDIIAQHHGAGIVTDERLAQSERLRKAIRRGLHLVGKAEAELRTVPQQVFKARCVLRCGDDEYLPYARQHEGGQGVVDHGLVVDGQQLFARYHGQRVEARPRATSQDNAFHSRQPFLPIPEFTNVSHFLHQRINMLFCSTHEKALFRRESIAEQIK